MFYCCGESFSYWVALAEIEASRGFVGGVLAEFFVSAELEEIH